MRSLQSGVSTASTDFERPMPCSL